VDLSEEENAPDVRLLVDWKEEHPFREEKDMLLMPWCFAVPLKPGRAEEAVRILDKVKAMPEAAKLMRDHDIIRSISYLQRAPQG